MLHYSCTLSSCAFKDHEFLGNGREERETEVAAGRVRFVVTSLGVTGGRGFRGELRIRHILQRRTVPTDNEAHYANKYSAN
jgi:hypothetical protein